MALSPGQENSGVVPPPLDDRLQIPTVKGSKPDLVSQYGMKDSAVMVSVGHSRRQNHLGSTWKRNVIIAAIVLFIIFLIVMVIILCTME